MNDAERIAICDRVGYLARPYALELINAKNQAYRERDQMVAAFARLCAANGVNVGVAQHEGPWEDDWRTIVYIDWPTGQVSWHIHDSERPLFAWAGEYNKAWDGHTSEQKYDRLEVSLPTPAQAPIAAVVRGSRRHRGREVSAPKTSESVVLGTGLR